MPDPNFDMPDSTHSFQARGGWLVKRFMSDFTLEDFQAAGIVGNIGFESGGFKYLQEIQPSVEGSRGGYGWAQWTGPRRRNFEAWCVRNKLKPNSDEANYGFLKFELQYAYRNTIQMVRKTKDLETSVFSVGQTYERPGGTTANNLPGFHGRLTYAKQALIGMLGPDHQQTNQVPIQPITIASSFPILRLGDKGEWVKKLQSKLHDLTYEVGEIDGEFGKLTQESVGEFQENNNLIPDGICGPKTWEILNKDNSDHG